MGNGLTAFIGICQTLECSWADTALWPTDKHTWGHAGDRTGAWEGSNPIPKSDKDEEILGEAGEKRLQTWLWLFQRAAESKGKWDPQV